MDRDNHYFDKIRSEILPLLPECINRALEIGCGEGNTLSWIKKTKGCSWVGGVELIPQAAKIAQEKLDEVYICNIENFCLPIPEQSLDLILCLDVLEHLIDPWATLTKVKRLLKPEGILIASIPNLRHYSIVMPLIFRGKFEYTEEGILDKTHLRFFVRETAIKLFEAAGLQVNTILIKQYDQNTKHRIARLFLPVFLKGILDYQYLISCSNKGIENDI